MLNGFTQRTVNTLHEFGYSEAYSLPKGPHYSFAKFRRNYAFDLALLNNLSCHPVDYHRTPAANFANSRGFFNQFAKIRGIRGKKQEDFSRSAQG